VLDVWKLVTVPQGRPRLLPTVSQEADASETQDHHGPSGWFGTAKMLAVTNLRIASSVAVLDSHVSKSWRIC